MPDLPKFEWVVSGCLPNFQRTENWPHGHSLDGDGARTTLKKGSDGIICLASGVIGSKDASFNQNTTCRQLSTMGFFVHISNKRDGLLPASDAHCLGSIKKPGGVPGLSGDPYENRTRDSSVKGRRLNRLTNGPCFKVCKDKTLRYFIKIFHERILYFYIPVRFTRCYIIGLFCARLPMEVSIL